MKLHPAFRKSERVLPKHARRPPRIQRTELALRARLGWATPKTRTRARVRIGASATPELGRERAEVMLDCVTHVVCGQLGLDTSWESVPYVAG